MLTGKLEKASLAKSMAESKLSDFEREKMIIELEIKEIIARHKTDVTEKMARAAQVRGKGLQLAVTNISMASAFDL